MDQGYDIVSGESFRVITMRLSGGRVYQQILYPDGTVYSCVTEIETEKTKTNWKKEGF